MSTVGATLYRRGGSSFAPRERRGWRGGVLPREDDVFFRPGVHLLAMRASQLVILQRRVRVEILVDRQACRREFRGRRASD